MTMIRGLMIRLDGYFRPGPKGLAILLVKGRLERDGYNRPAIKGRLLRADYSVVASLGWLHWTGQIGLAITGWLVLVSAE